MTAFHGARDWNFGAPSRRQQANILWLLLLLRCACKPVMATLSSAMGARGGVLFAFTLAFLLTCLGLFGLSLTQYGEPQKCKLHHYTTEALYSNNQYYRKWMAGMSNLNFPCSGTETLPGWPILGPPSARLTSPNTTLSE